MPGTQMHELVHADGVWAGLTRYTAADGPVPCTPDHREVALILEGLCVSKSRTAARWI